MRRAVAEVDHFLRMTDGPCAALFLVARVGARRRVTQPQRLRHVVGQTLNRSSNPPLPTPMNLPFHLSMGGSHISISM